MATHIDLSRIRHVVQQYFQYVVLSHKWEDNEPLFQEVIQITVYDLCDSPTHDKLQTYCKIGTQVSTGPGVILSVSTNQMYQCSKNRWLPCSSGTKVRP